jgi:putative DNA primase/helicase
MSAAMDDDGWSDIADDIEQRERDAIRDDGAEPRKDGVLFENCTDLGNARRLAMQHGDRLRYAEQLGGWFVYDGRRWQRDETGEVFRSCEQTVRSIYQEAAIAVAQSDRERLSKWALRSESRARIDAAIALARHQPPIAARATDFDADPLLFNVENGTIELRGQTLRPHRRDDLITKLAPVTYDPTATAPLWLKTLERIFDGRPELIAFVQRFVGHALTGLTTEQVLLLLHGVGANGKSTFVEVIRALLGDYAQSADFGTFLARDSAGVRNDLARLVGARLVSAVEMSRGGRLDEAVVKQVTGGDMITARFLFREHFEFRPAFKLVLVANHKPRIRGTDYAIWRRVRLVPFDVIIPEDERDPLLQEKIITTELSGVLNWALEGCRMWQAEGLGAPDEVKAATDAYREEQDVLGPFLDDCCERGERFSASASAIYAAFKRWAEAAGERPVSQRTLGEWLRERGFSSKHTKSGSEWLGLRVKGEA